MQMDGAAAVAGGNPIANRRSQSLVRMIEHFLHVEQSFDTLVRDRLGLRSELMGIINGSIQLVLIMFAFACGWILVTVLACGDVRLVAYLLTFAYFCGLPLPLILTLFKLNMKKEHCSYLRHRQLIYEGELELLEQMMNSISVEVPGFFDERLKYVKDDKIAKVNIGKYYIFYLLLITFAIVAGLLLPVVVDLVYNHVPREEVLDSSCILKTIVQKMFDHCVPIGGNRRDI